MCFFSIRANLMVENPSLTCCMLEFICDAEESEDVWVVDLSHKVFNL